MRFIRSFSLNLLFSQTVIGLQIFMLQSYSNHRSHKTHKFSRYCYDQVFLILLSLISWKIDLLGFFLSFLKLYLFLIPDA